MWVVSSRFVNAVPPPNARCSLLLLLLLHVMKEMICAKRFQEAAIGQAIEGFEGSKKKSMDAKHFIRYVYISLYGFRHTHIMVIMCTYKDGI